MNLGEMVTEVITVVDDAAYTSTIVKSLINEAVLDVATGRMFPGSTALSPPLPNLYTSGDVLTVVGKSILTLPADFNRDVFQVIDDSEASIPIRSSLRQFLRLWPDETVAGVVENVVVQGNRMLYRDRPAAAETLTIHYYKNPTTLTDDADIPDSVPTQLHRSLLIAYALKEIYNQIEMGIKGPKVDTINYTSIFNQGLAQLQGFLPEDGNPMYYEDTTDYING